MRAWIIAAGVIEDASFYRSIKIKEEDLVVCADGGLDHALFLGFKPNAVIGDMDSTMHTPFGDFDVVTYDKEKDKTDTHLAIDYALERGAEEIMLIGALGGRVDHYLANVMLLRYIAEMGAEGLIVSKQSRICLVTSSTTILRGKGDSVSLIPLSEKVEGVTTTGLKYRLKNETLQQGDTLGMSNEFVEHKAVVKVTSGMLLVVCSN